MLSIKGIIPLDGVFHQTLSSIEVNSIDGSVSILEDPPLKHADVRLERSLAIMLQI